MHSGRAPCFSEPRPALLVAWADLRATCAYPVQGCRPVTNLYTFRFRQNSSAAFSRRPGSPPSRWHEATTPTAACTPLHGAATRLWVVRPTLTGS